MDVTRPATYDLSDYLSAFRRSWWVALSGALLGLAVTGTVTLTQGKVYQSSASVLVQPTGVDTNVIGGRTKGEINLDTEAQLIKSTAVAADAGTLLRSNRQPQQLARRVSVEVPPNTSVLLITYSEHSPEAAQAGAHAFAEAYLANRNDSAKAELASQSNSLDRKIKQVSSDLAATTSSNKADQNSRRENLADQLKTLSGRLNQLSTLTINGGKIISDADLPNKASKPSIPLNLGSGLLAGLILGIGAALFRERLDRRVRRGIDLPRRAGVPLLAAMGNIDQAFNPHTECGRAFARLRNEIIATPQDPRADGSPRTCRLIVVTSVSPGPAATLVAANLAGAFTHAGHNVSLATRPIADTARQPQLEAARQDLERLRSEADYVIIEAPSTAVSADAQSLASLADAAILAVELRRSTHVEVLDAALQLRRVDTLVLGGVVIPSTHSPARPAGRTSPGRSKTLGPLSGNSR